MTFTGITFKTQAWSWISSCFFYQSCCGRALLGLTRDVAWFFTTHMDPPAIIADLNVKLSSWLNLAHQWSSSLVKTDINASAGRWPIACGGVDAKFKRIYRGGYQYHHLVFHWTPKKMALCHGAILLRPILAAVFASGHAASAAAPKDSTWMAKGSCLPHQTQLDFRDVRIQLMKP